MKISVITPTIRPGGLKIVQSCLQNQTFQDFEWLVEVGMPKRGCDLSSAYNRMLRRATGDIIVIYQDFIEIPRSALGAIIKLNHDKTAYTYPVGKVENPSDKPVKWDWRHNKTGKIEPQEWEIDFASAPRSLFFDVGGFDEDFDRGWSWENVNIAQRADKAGYSFECSGMVSAIALDHDLKIKHPFRNVLNNNTDLIAIKNDAIKQGFWKLDYI